MSTARQITSLPRAGAVSLYDQFAIWQRGRTTICDVNDLLAFLQIGLRGPQGEPGPPGPPGPSVIVTPGGDIDTAALNFPTLAASNSSAKAATTQFVHTLLGSGVGVSWLPFQTRLLVTKDHVGEDTQQIIDFQANTRPGSLGTFESTSSGVSITSRSLPGTTYGMFNLVALMENFAERLPGGVDTGNTGANLYTRQHYVNAVSGWGYAAEAKETHGLPNPTNGTLAGENAIVATGTDNNHKRGALFLPLNILPGKEATFTEAYHGLYAKTAPNTRYYHGALFEGDYINVITANGVNASSFATISGNFSNPVIDLHSVQTAASSGAILSINPLHNIQWRTTENNFVVGLGVDYSVSDGNAFSLSGVKKRGSSGAPDGFMEITINGQRKCIAVLNLA